jgi:predicted nucleic acid-binding protein
MKCVVDTNIFNKLIDGSLSTEDIPADAELVATHVQIDELNRTRDDERRARLFLRFATLVDSVIPTESTVLGVSRLNHSKLSDGGLYNRLKIDLDSLNKGKTNNTHDVLIAEVAIANGHTLLTADYHLAEVAKKHGGRVRHFGCSSSLRSGDDLAEVTR